MIMNFWDYNIWSTLVQLSVVLLSILLGNIKCPSESDLNSSK